MHKNMSIVGWLVCVCSVILSPVHGNNPGWHAVVGYGVNSNNTEIICHYGWSNQAHVVYSGVMTGYTFFRP